MSARRFLGVWSWAMVLIIIMALGLPFYLISPRYVLNPVSVAYDHETQRITLVRETPAARDFPWLTTFAEYHAEASLLSNPVKTCPGPAGSTEYEILDGEPPNTTTLDASWINACTNGADTIYRVSYKPALQINRGVFEGWRVTLPRRVVLQTVIRPQSEALETRIEEIESLIQR